MYLLVADLGRPERFHHMLRVAKPTSPMSVGTWILAPYAPGVGSRPLSELLPAEAAPHAARPAAGPARRDRRAMGGGARARRRVLHGGAAVADRCAGLARGAPVPAVRVHRLDAGQQRRHILDRGQFLRRISSAASARPR